MTVGGKPGRILNRMPESSQADRHIERASTWMLIHRTVMAVHDVDEGLTHNEKSICRGHGWTLLPAAPHPSG